MQAVYDNIIAFQWNFPWLTALVIIAIFFFTKKFFAVGMSGIIAELAYRHNAQYRAKLRLSLQKPLIVLWIILGGYLVTVFLVHMVSFSGLNLKTITYLFWRTAVPIIITYALWHLAAPDSVIVENISHNWPSKQFLIPVFTKAFRFVVVLLCAVMIAREWGYDANGFIAGLGLGGLAFALAGQELLSNLFAGIVILLEKPFVPGEWISNPYVEGTVESIGWRSTRVRTLANAQVIVPNALFNKSELTNWTKCRKKLVDFGLSLSNKTGRERLETTMDAIRAMLQNHAMIDQEDIVVHFDNLEESSFNITVHCYTKTTQLSEYRQVKNDINFKIMSILETHGVKLALPSRNLHFQTDVETIDKTGGAFQ